MSSAADCRHRLEPLARCQRIHLGKRAVHNQSVHTTAHLQLHAGEQPIEVERAVAGER